ncbi:Uma2 family endonuclease [Benzoatithermus flavus]|uniref:Uma2 family endonuclease n=1 Tax=Benzoatithermus flavus TaxID=3108223 RepID=A0ABU8XTI0_9PROT
MTGPAEKRMTVDEFLRWDDGTDTRYELVDGVIRAMAPPGGAHGTVAANATALIHAALRSRRPCRPQAEAGVRINDQTWWQADIAVTCKPPAPEIVEPLLVIEVLSPHTRAHDLGRKLDDYKTLPSVQEIWMIDSEKRWAQVWRRGDEGRLGQDLVGSAVFESGVLQAFVPLDELYADSGLRASFRG